MKKDIFIKTKTLENNTNGILKNKTFAVQPNISVKGWITDSASKVLENYAALDDSTIVKRLLENGATLKGSTAMNELGFGISENTAARAVLEKLIDISFVIDIMGETSVLSAMSKVIGYKPSYGIISRYGLIGLIPSMECCGIISAQLDNISETVRIISGKDENDLSMISDNYPDFDKNIDSDKNVNIAILKESLDVLTSDEKELFLQSIEKLKNDKIKINEVSLSDFVLLKEIHNVIGSVEASSNCGKYDSVRYGYRTKTSKNWNEMYIKSREEALGILIKQYLFQGGYFQYKKYKTFENACRLRTRICNTEKKIFADNDVIILPALRFENNISYGNDIDKLYKIFSLTLLQSITGSPSITLPGIVCSNKYDLGLQLIGGQFQDAELFNTAKKVIISGSGK